MSGARSIPRDRTLDATIGLVRRPYTYISERCRRRGVDALRTRVMLRRAIIMTGPQATRLFYEEDRFERHGAMPRRPRIPLLGRGGVQGLDGPAHRDRKAVFIGLVSPGRAIRLAEAYEGEWRRASGEWATRSRVDLYRHSQEMLTRVVCDWAGVPVDPRDLPDRSATLASLFDGAGALGPRYWRARLARARARRWIEGLVSEVRRGELGPPPGSALHAFATVRDHDGEPLSTRDAATEVLNVLRPTVAVAVYVVFIAQALARYPAWRDRLRDADHEARPELLRRFVQEVRRFYPFFPVVAARTRRGFEWNGLAFPSGRLVVLDLYGTNHDPRAWERPGEFDPDRFESGRGVGGRATLEAAACPRGLARDRCEFVPQGGDDATTQHRCPGEPIAVELMMVAAEWLACRLEYKAPVGDLSIDMGRLPALPRVAMVLAGVRPRPTEGREPVTGP